MFIRTKWGRKGFPDTGWCWQSWQVPLTCKMGWHRLKAAHLRGSVCCYSWHTWRMGLTSLCYLLSSFWIILLWSISHRFPSQPKRLNDHTTRQKLKGAAERNVSCAGRYTNHWENSIVLGGDPDGSFEALCFHGFLWDSIKMTLSFYFRHVYFSHLLEGYLLEGWDCLWISSALPYNFVHCYEESRY